MTPDEIIQLGHIMTLEEKITQIDNRYIDGRITLLSCRLLARRVRYLPPGRARLATNLLATGSAIVRKKSLRTPSRDQKITVA